MGTIVLKDFPNLKVGGLLPDPETKREGETTFETQEWRVIIFPRGQGYGRKVIHPDPSYNNPPKGDWAHHSCCGTVCTVRSAPLWNITDRERFGPAPPMNHPHLREQLSLSSYGQLPDSSWFDPVGIMVETPR